MKNLKVQISFIAWLLILSATVCAEEDFRGLWVGQATLTHVNQVTIPLDEDNIAIAPNPDIPTNTADAAHLRLILHVNGEGQVNLLKDVAILKRQDPTNSVVSSSEGNLALVSDERLYDDFPVQQAVRIASAAFDFGDYKATAAVDAVVDEIVEQVALSVDGSGINASSSTAALRNAEDVAQAAAEAGVADAEILELADVAEEFTQFMIDFLNSGAVEDLAGIGTFPTGASDAAAELAAAFYGDTRAEDVLEAIYSVYTNEVLFPGTGEKEDQGLFIAARYYDTENSYQRFITGDSFGAMIPAAAYTAAMAVVSNASPSGAVDVITEVSSAEAEASITHISRYNDTAALDAVNIVLDAIIEAAENSTNDVREVIQAEAEAAGVATLATNVPRFSIPILTPTADYTEFVNSDEFMNSVSGAAEAAALAAVSEKQNDPFSTTNSLGDAALIAATEALRSVYILAARARRTELPMDGTFGPGQGDPRLTGDAGVGSLGAAGLECTIHLPASHPTNPFRHPKHPDHTVGIDITRLIRLDFGTNTVRSATGQEQVTGIYREEVFGLHKKLGQNRDTGLKVEGTFELNRISLVDTLNSL